MIFMFMYIVIEKVKKKQGGMERNRSKKIFMIKESEQSVVRELERDVVTSYFVMLIFSL